ncbi:DeoR/GlpR family DNA-binding transcription regulator [Nioella ostreopsis]|uniref:DeoR/GlpR family DNA-binding transcription regulator n=1 Tax=Nioella ostreopsis TaxID=2448479 RepID=UPI000FD9BB17|nr:DeoR/GlpR family DNA-binding transcription regulator [Nioella ostreopsis]
MALSTRPSSGTPARAQEILDLLRLSGGSCRINALAEAIGVTEETVRRNIKRLTTEGLVQKFHGSVQLVEAKTELSFSVRMAEEPDAKRRIAAHVAAKIPSGASLFLDIGSTTAYIAQALQGHSDLFVVTNSVAVAHALAARNGNRVFMPGGELRPHDGGIFGVDALDFISRFQADFAILSIAAIDALNTFSIFDLEEAKYSRAIMDRAATRIVAADSSKFGRRAPIALANPELLDLLITDNQPPADISAKLAELEIEIALATSLPQTGQLT